VLLVCLAATARAAGAQTDFYNTDRGRPQQIEDAAPVEWRALELQAAPLRLERGRGGIYQWGVEPELAWGVLPRTQIEVGVPLAWRDVPAGGGVRRGGVAGVEIAALHQLNTESWTLPAFAVSASVLAPVGALAPRAPYATATAITTRTFAWGRAHANAAVTAGPRLAGAGAITAGPAAQELSRWLAGVALDHTWAVRSLLGGVEAVARRPLDGGAVEWSAGTGVRGQLGPRVAMDAGIGRRLTGDDRGWYVTVGSAYAFGLPRTFGGR
jgi:hypothetical protein